MLCRNLKLVQIDIILKLINEVKRPLELSFEVCDKFSLGGIVRIIGHYSSLHVDHGSRIVGHLLQLSSAEEGLLHYSEVGFCVFDLLVHNSILNNGNDH